MKYVIDTEFAEQPGKMELISIGVACEDGRIYYAENAEFSGECNEWVKENVLPKLKGGICSRTLSQIKNELIEFIDKNPEFWAYYADYDWVNFCWIFGSMVDLPDNYPMICLDLQQVWLTSGKPNCKPPDPDEDHHAAADALWGIDFLKILQARNLI